MARSDLVLNLVQTAMKGEMGRFKETVETLIAEERSKNHHVYAEQLAKIIQKQSAQKNRKKSLNQYSSSELNDSVYGIIPRKKLSELVLSKKISEQINDLVEEHNRRDILRSYNLEPKSKVLLYGPPGNGKTSVAEALAESLSLPFFFLKYEDVIESYLGSSAKKLDKVFDYVKGQRCVFFMDEFESIAKERGDEFDSGEIKRIVSSLLLQIDSLPSHVILVAATNHTKLVDKAFWRRFQLHINFPNPNQTMIKNWFKLYEKIHNRNLGFSPDELSINFKGSNFSELEEFTLDVFRKYVLQLPDENIKKITAKKLTQWKSRLKGT